jgi:hypothetical protein
LFRTAAGAAALLFFRYKLELLHYSLPSTNNAVTAEDTIDKEQQFLEKPFSRKDAKAQRKQNFIRNVRRLKKMNIKNFPHVFTSRYSDFQASVVDLFACLAALRETDVRSSFST